MLQSPGNQPDPSSRFGHLRGVRWRINLGVLPSSISSSIDDLRRVTADSRRRYAALRRRLLIDPHLLKLNNDSLDLEVDNPLSQNPESSWGHFFRNAELEKMVDQDLSRLYPEHWTYFQTPGCQALLRRILLLWCLGHPECGYRQGMHELVAPLLYVLHADIQHLTGIRKLYEDYFVDYFDEVMFQETHDFNFRISSHDLEDYHSTLREQSKKHKTLSDLDANTQTTIMLNDPYGAEGELGIVLSDKFMEHDVYCMFDALMSGAGGTVAMADFYSPLPANASHTGLAPVIEASLSLYHLLSIVDSSLYSHLVELGVEPQYFALRWLRVLFGREFSLENLLLVWDEIFSFDNSKPVKSLEDDHGILSSHRGAFISAMAVSMMLSMRSSLLASEYAASCLQRLLNFSQDVDRNKLIGKAKSLVALAMETNSSSHWSSVSGYDISNKRTSEKGLGRSQSHSLDSSSHGRSASLVPERFWEEQWRSIHQEGENSSKKVSSKKKSWTEKVKLRLSRTKSELSLSKKENRERDYKSSTQKNLLEDLNRQLNLDEDTEDPKSSSTCKVPVPHEHESTASEEQSHVFSDSEKSSFVSNVSHDITDNGTQNSSSFVSALEEDPAATTVACDMNNIGVSGTDDVPREALATSSKEAVATSPKEAVATSPKGAVATSSKEALVTSSKERKVQLATKLQWLWKFGRHTNGEGSSSRNKGNEVRISSTETNYDLVNIKADGCDRDMICTLRNLGQSMLENIQVIEAALHLERNQSGQPEHLSRDAQGEKGRVTAATALDEVRRISNILCEM